jgi:hypothetical protein
MIGLTGSVPESTEVIEGDTKVVTEYRRMDNGKLQKVKTDG